VEITDVDIDSQFRLGAQYGLALFLGTLYHLKNPFYALETLAHHARFCFVSTRVARRSPDGAERLDQMPVAYLLGESQCNADSTNYWIFSPPGLTLLLERAGWTIRGVASTGNPDSDPASPDHDERMFALVSSRYLVSR
jgi:tRNA (mo5U34)-methyltransferase